MSLEVVDERDSGAGVVDEVRSLKHETRTENEMVKNHWSIGSVAWIRTREPGRLYLRRALGCSLGSKVKEV